MSDSRSLTARVADVQRSKRLKAPDYFKKAPAGYPTQTLCKVCGVPIAGLVVHERPIETVRSDGKVVVRERLVFAAFSNYASVELEFEDGSKHHTPLCAECVGRLDADTAEDAYLADVADTVTRSREPVDLRRFDHTTTVRRWRRID